MKDTNPFNLKVLEDQPKEYLDTDEFIKYLNNKHIENKFRLKKDKLCLKNLKTQTLIQ